MSSKKRLTSTWAKDVGPVTAVDSGVDMSQMSPPASSPISAGLVKATAAFTVETPVRSFKQEADRFPSSSQTLPPTPSSMWTPSATALATPTSKAPTPKVIAQAGTEEPVLSQEQSELVDLICERHNFFYTGSTGCGKSTVLKAFVKKLRAKNLR